jgi:hypothetical protein
VVVDHLDLRVGRELPVTPESGSVTRSKENFTSSAVIGAAVTEGGVLAQVEDVGGRVLADGEALGEPGVELRPSGEFCSRLAKTCPCAQSDSLSFVNFGSQRFTSAGRAT